MEGGGDIMPKNMRRAGVSSVLHDARLIEFDRIVRIIVGAFSRWVF